MARLILGPEMNIQAPPNLSPGVYQRLIAAGINDWGGVSPVTPDHVNPEAPWPAIDELARKTRRGRQGAGRAARHLSGLRARARALAGARAWRRSVRRMSDAEGLAREDDWAPGNTEPPPRAAGAAQRAVDPRDRAHRRSRRPAASASTEAEIVRLFAARDADYRHVTARGRRAAPGGERRRRQLRRQPQHQLHQHLLLTAAASAPSPRAARTTTCAARPTISTWTRSSRRAVEAWERGATEVCLQGGIHPDYTGETYLAICRADQAGGARHARPRLLAARGDAGRGDARAVRSTTSSRGCKRRGARHACPAPRPRSSTTRCARSSARTRSTPPNGSTCMRAAHALGLRTTATIMFGHVERSLALGAPPAGAARPAGRDRRLHRVRAAALRAHGSADVPARAGRAGARPSARRC